MVSRSLPHEYFVLEPARTSGAVIGHRRGQPIAASVIDRDGGHYRFVGVAARDSRGRLDVMALKQGEWIVAPDLIYTEAA